MNNDREALEKRIPNAPFWANLVHKIDSIGKAKGFVRDGLSGEEVLDKILIEDIKLDQVSLYIDNSGFESKETLLGSTKVSGFKIIT